MGSNKSKHRMKKKRRHERQIAEGTRAPAEKARKTEVKYVPRRVTRLSELDPDDVRKVLEIVKNLRLYPDNKVLDR